MGYANEISRLNNEIEKYRAEYEGANSWTPDGKGKDLRLIEKVPAVEMAVLIENYMMHQPVSK